MLDWHESMLIVGLSSLNTKAARAPVWWSEASHEPQKVAQASCLFGADRLEACPTLQPPPRFMAPIHVRILEVFPSHEPGGARLRRALTDSCGWEIRARRSLAPPFMVQMRGCKTVETSHEPQKVAQASCLFGTDRLEACPTLQPAPRFMAPTHFQFLEVLAFP